MKLILLFGIGLMALGIISCGSKKKQAPPPVIVEAPDYTPLSEGWKVQSYSALGVAVIIAIALMSRGKNN